MTSGTTRLKMSLQSVEVALRQELFDSVLPFWMKHSHDEVHGGFLTGLDRDGSVYDTTKYAWLQGRQIWMFASLASEPGVQPALRETLVDQASQALAFLDRHALHGERRVYFSMARDGRPLQLQRKIFSECFYTLALSGLARALQDERLWHRALSFFVHTRELAGNPAALGRAPLSAAVAGQRSLAVPMILLNLLEELVRSRPAGLPLGSVWPGLGDPDAVACALLEQVLDHHKPETGMVFENIGLDGALLGEDAGPSARLVNPGHAIEAGWFVLHWAIRLGRADWQERAIALIRSSHDHGWDPVHGGLFSFLDADQRSPVQLEWHMKLWWPHCEALYAHLLCYSLTRSSTDLARFEAVFSYIWNHFRDPEHGEWFGYLDREGRVTHRFKGGPYKGAFHVPRTLSLCLRLFEELRQKGALSC